MYQKSFYKIIFLGFFLILNSCVQNDVVLEVPNSVKSNEDNPWANEIDVDDVNISDLDNNITETQTIITEDGTTKIKRIPFPIDEYKSLKRVGKGVVKGKIFIQTANEEIVFGKNTRLYLNPLTSYSMQWYNQSYIADKKMEKVDKRLFNYLKFTASGANGEFAFYGVSTGSYYLIGTVTCGIECGFDVPKNIKIAQQINIKGKQVISVDLTKNLK